jgi:hypothetical protein
VEQRAPNGLSNVDDVLPFEQRKAIVRGYAGAAGFAQNQVNRPAGKGGVTPRGNIDLRPKPPSRSRIAK